MPERHDWETLLTGELRNLAQHDDLQRERLIAALPPPQQRVINELWKRWSHEGQCPDDSDWRVWMIQAGRGYGKTRAGSEWISALAREDGSLRFALVGATIEDVRKVMIEGKSGLLAVARTREDVTWHNRPNGRRRASRGNGSGPILWLPRAGYGATHLPGA
jgi:phage terminase large subunit-like protein